MRHRDVLVVGSGAREHALAWKLRQSPEVGELYVAPGNAGTELVARNVPIGVADLLGLVRFVEDRDIDLTVVGPEAPLALGLADRLQTQGRRVVGPGAAAARIEASKAFAKEVMARAGVPTARYRVFDAADEAARYLHGATYPLVIKADGLASGKGVVVCEDAAKAQRVVRAMMLDQIHGAAGRRVVIEEALIGREVSLLALVDGKRVVPLPAAQDHKRLGDGDTGPNTGGMGAYAPVPFLDQTEQAALVEMILEPVVAALAEAGMPYRGVLFAGLMLTAAGPRVLEFNCRFGDPEAQAILPLLADDLLPWLEAVAAGELTGTMPLRERRAVGVVLAAPGYPSQPSLGARIEGLDDVPPEVLVFHGGTARDAAGRFVTAGGRVLTVVGTGRTLEEASQRAYAAPLRFEGMQLRSDIAPQQLSSAPTRRARIGVLASGEGTNLQALLDAAERGEVDAQIAVVVSNHPQARALERTRAAGIPALTLPLHGRRSPEERHVFERRLLELLAPFQLDLIVLAGWMLILSADFLERCACPLLNVHPALLPTASDGTLDVPILRGCHAVRDALALHLPYTGVSVHLVTAEVDAGPVVRREVVTIEPADDEATLYRRIKAVEHRLLPEAVQTVLASRKPGGVHA